MTEYEWVIAVEAAPLVLSLSFLMVAQGIYFLRESLLRILIKNLPTILDKMKLDKEGDTYKFSVGDNN